MMLYPYIGSSMAGTLSPGDQIQIEIFPFENLCPGDIVVFSSSKHPEDVIHRVIARLPDGMQTQGDRSPHPDKELVTADRYIGKVTEVIRGNRRIRVAGGRRGLRQAKRGRIYRRLQGIPAGMVRPIRRRFGDDWVLASAAKLPGVRHVTFTDANGARISKLIWNHRVLATKQQEDTPWKLRFRR